MTLAARVIRQAGSLALDVSLDIADAEVLAVLGPNGAGKTTLLRAIAGLDPLDEGHVTIDGTVVDGATRSSWLPPERRPTGVVSQDPMLFPHLDALDNVAFGPRCQGATKAEARRIAQEWLDRLELSALAQRRPRQLSGGEVQRVALARALAPKPRLLLLDEPLSALDAGTRIEIRRQLRRQIEGIDASTLLVTHDPVDALALADRVAILEEGRIVQQGPLAEVTARPRSRYVADLVGVNLLRGVASGTVIILDTGGRLRIPERAEGRVLAIVAPNAVTLSLHDPQSSARNAWSLRIEGFDLLGDRVRVRLTGELDLVAEITAAAVADLGLREGDQVVATVKATEVTAYSE